MDAEVTQLVGAGPYERSDTRLTQRNGYREREWDTRVGTMELQIPKLRQGTYFPGVGPTTSFTTATPFTGATSEPDSPSWASPASEPPSEHLVQTPSLRG
jgi:hypothetical protein